MQEASPAELCGGANHDNNAWRAMKDGPERDGSGKGEAAWVWESEWRASGN